VRVREALAGRHGDRRLQFYIVWVPILLSTERDLARAQEAVGYPRALHYWDAGAVLPQRYQELLVLPERAWDVYFVYPAGVRWNGTLPPEPEHWMHQMRRLRQDPATRELWLDAQALGGRIAELLARARR
jgi:hypothetical protein